MTNSTYTPKLKVGDIIFDADKNEYKIIDFTERNCGGNINPCYKLEQLETKRIFICPCHTGDKW